MKKDSEILAGLKKEFHDLSAKSNKLRLFLTHKTFEVGDMEANRLHIQKACMSGYEYILLQRMQALEEKIAEEHTR
jgi:hypothetical protein